MAKTVGEFFELSGMPKARTRRTRVGRERGYVFPVVSGDTVVDESEWATPPAGTSKGCDERRRRR